MTTVDRLMEMADAYAEEYSSAMVPQTKQAVIEARAALLTALQELTAKLDAHIDWREASGWKHDEQAKEIARLKCQIELSGKTIAYAEFSSNGNIRMWTKPDSATPEQRKVMVPLCISPKTHYSDCAIYNEPAYPAGDCDCGVTE